MTLNPLPTSKDSLATIKAYATAQGVTLDMALAYGQRNHKSSWLMAISEQAAVEAIAQPTEYEFYCDETDTDDLESAYIAIATYVDSAIYEPIADNGDLCAADLPVLHGRFSKRYNVIRMDKAASNVDKRRCALYGCDGLSAYDTLATISQAVKPLKQAAIYRLQVTRFIALAVCALFVAGYEWLIDNRYIISFVLSAIAMLFLTVALSVAWLCERLASAVVTGYQRALTALSSPVALDTGINALHGILCR